MPITKSAIKRMKSDKKKHESNKKSLSQLKNLYKTFTKLLESKDIEKARLEAKNISKEYDKAASKGIIPRQRASRKKSRINKALNKLITANSNK